MIFGRFRLDIVNQCLWRGAEEINLTPKSFAVLRYLIERRSLLVSKDELLDAVWQRRFVSDSALKACISEIRKALADDPKAPRFIETRHRRGYRFVAEVSASDPAGHGTRARSEITATPPQTSSDLEPPVDRVVGRQLVLDRMRGHLREAARGKRQVVFITGEPGIGKTTIVRAFLRDPEHNGTYAAYGKCVEHFAVGEPYLPVLEALSGMAHSERRSRLVRVLREYAPTWLAQLPRLVESADRAAFGLAVLGANRDRMMREMGEAIDVLSEDAPVVLVLDDLHWSDVATVDLIAFLTLRQSRARLLILGTYRPTDLLQRPHELVKAKQELELHANCVEIPLQFLNEADVAEYLASRYGTDECVGELTRKLYLRTEGNPLFIVSVLDYLEVQQVLRPAEGGRRLSNFAEAIDTHIPDNLQHMIARQMDLMSPECRRSLEIASASGRVFSSAETAAALGENAAVVEERYAALARHQQFIARAGPIERSEHTVTKRYTFIHSYFQQAWYEQVAAARRVHYHRVLGEYLVRAHADREDDTAAEIAWHFERGGAYAQAIRFFERAAHNAGRRLATREAVSYLTRALDLIQRCPADEQSEFRLRLLAQRGLLRRATAEELRGAIDDFTLMATVAQEAARPDYQVRALLYLAIVHVWVDVERCLDLAHQAVRASLATHDTLLHAHARGFYGHWHSLFREWTPDDVSASADALSAARRNGDRTFLVIHLRQNACFLFLRSEYAAASNTAQEGMRLALELGDAFEYMVCQFYHGLALLHRGRWGEMHTVVSAGIQMAERNRNPFWTVLFRLELAWLHIHAFDFDSARVICEQDLELSRSLDYAAGRLLSLVFLGAALLGLRRYQEAYRTLREARAQAESNGARVDWYLRMPLSQAFSTYFLAKGDLVQARRQAERTCELAAQPGERTWLAFGHLTLAHAAGDAAAAHEQLKQALALVSKGDVPVAEWQVCAQAWQLAPYAALTAEASFWRDRSAVVLRQLAASLDELPALKQKLLESEPARSVLSPHGARCKWSE